MIFPLFFVGSLLKVYLPHFFGSRPSCQEGLSIVSWYSFLRDLQAEALFIDSVRPLFQRTPNFFRQVKHFLMHLMYSLQYL